MSRKLPSADNTHKAMKKMVYYAKGVIRSLRLLWSVISFIYSFIARPKNRVKVTYRHAKKEK